MFLSTPLTDWSFPRSPLCLEKSVGSKESKLGSAEKLRSVVAVFRHGDRTPKQKLKMKTAEQAYIDFFYTATIQDFSSSSSSPTKTHSPPPPSLMLKSAAQLQKFLDISRGVFERLLISTKDQL